MIKKSVLLTALACVLLLVVIGANTVYTEKAYAPVKEVIWDKPENKVSIAHTELFGPLERSQVIFDHKKHTEALVKEGKKEEETCNTCHPLDKWDNLIFEFPKKLVGKDRDSIMNSYHAECTDCHKKRGAEGKKAGPVTSTCGDCHKKELEHVKVNYPVVEFDFAVHDKHVKNKKLKKDCSLCHHTYDTEEPDETLRLVYEQGTEESCYYCHDIEKKRGPELTPIVRAAAKKGLTIRKASHLQCLNCHVEFTKKAKKDEKVGPVECSKCHTGEYKTVAELSKVPRPDRNQPEKPFIDIENARMKGVLLDHKFHEKNNNTCRGCHHETLKACKECHGLTGSDEGRWVNTANAYHNVFSEHSCTGCHNMKKKEKDCAGCHHNILAMDIETMSPKKEVCARCHTGKKERLPSPLLDVSKLDPEKVKKEVTVKMLEKEYEPAKFPHLDIIKKLVKISNDSKMATYFHAKMQTICDGCHHQSRAEAEAKKDTPPNCRSCHSIAFDPQNLNKVRLLTAYHNQCMGCHEQMEIEKGRIMEFGEGDRCTVCHKEKEERLSITTVKNFEEPVRLLEKLGWEYYINKKY